MLHREVRVSALVHAALALSLAFVMLGSDRLQPLYNALASSDSYDDWVGLFFLAGGLMQGYGAIWVRRRARQWGLAVSSVGFAAVCGALIGSWTAGAMIFGIIAAYGFCSVLRDVFGKPRAKCLHN